MGSSGQMLARCGILVSGWEVRPVRCQIQPMEAVGCRHRVVEVQSLTR
jgi:hypothetical protein